MNDNRHLEWEGCHNVRDLGGLPVRGGGKIRWGALVRGDCPDRLTKTGWSALQEHGIRTIVDLRNDDELGADLVQRPDGITTLHMPLDHLEDTGFWAEWGVGQRSGTPLYYLPFLQRFPDGVARVVEAVAAAAPGGVFVHCRGGRDRTGLVVMVLLALVGTSASVIAADYALSAARLHALYRVRKEPDQGPEIDAFLASHGVSAHDAVVLTLESIDLSGYLGTAGLRSDRVELLRRRLLAP